MYSSYSSSSSAMGRPIVRCFPLPFRSGMSLEDVLLTYPAARFCPSHHADDVEDGQIIEDEQRHPEASKTKDIPRQGDDFAASHPGKHDCDIGRERKDWPVAS